MGRLLRRSTLFPYTTLFRSPKRLAKLLEEQRLLEKQLAELEARLARSRAEDLVAAARQIKDRKSTRLNSSHRTTSYAVLCLKKKTSVTCLPASPSPPLTLWT